MDNSPKGKILLYEEPMIAFFSKWLGWTIILIIVMVFCIYVSNRSIQLECPNRVVKDGFESTGVFSRDLLLRREMSKRSY